MSRSAWRCCATEPDRRAQDRRLPPRAVRRARLPRRHGGPERPEDLLDHRCLLLRFPGSQQYRWTLRTPEGPEPFAVAGPFDADDGDVLTEWALLGAGIAMKPVFEVAEHLRAGRLVPRPARHPPEPVTLAVVYPHRRLLPAKVKAFADFTVQEVATASRRAATRRLKGELARCPGARRWTLDAIPGCDKVRLECRDLASVRRSSGAGRSAGGQGCGRSTDQVSTGAPRAAAPRRRLAVPRERRAVFGRAFDDPMMKLLWRRDGLEPGPRGAVRALQAWSRDGGLPRGEPWAAAPPRPPLGLPPP